MLERVSPTSGLLVIDALDSRKELRGGPHDDSLESERMGQRPMLAQKAARDAVERMFKRARIVPRRSRAGHCRQSRTLRDFSSRPGQSLPRITPPCGQ
jgi:hypothetical protein